jgi:hypothetical protein
VASVAGKVGRKWMSDHTHQAKGDRSLRLIEANNLPSHPASKAIVSISFKRESTGKWYECRFKKILSGN